MRPESKLKAITGNEINVSQKRNFTLGKIVNIVGKGENAVYQHFLLFLHCFQKAFSGCLTLSQTSPGFYVSAVEAL